VSLKPSPSRTTPHLGRKRKTNKHLPQKVYVYRGKYQLRYRDGHTKLFPSLDECLSAWSAEYGQATGDRISDIIADYRGNVLGSKALRTQKDYLAAIGRLEPVFGAMRLRDLHPAHVYRYQEARSRQGAKVHVNREVAVLSVICSHGVRLGHADRNICREVRRRPEKPRRRYVSDPELWIVYNCAPGYIRRAMVLTLITGIRLGDLFKIGPENHTHSGFLYRQNKTGRELLFEWTDELRRCAARPPVSYAGFTTAWQRTIRRALSVGLEERFTFHDLRAKAGTDGQDWRMLGHTSREMFERVYNRAPVRIVNTVRSSER